MNQNNHSDRLFVLPSQRDHYQGILSASVVLVEYGNYQCPLCGEVHRLIQAIQQNSNSILPGENQVCVVFRHFIENSIHPQAQKAAEVAEAAAAQGRFWQMHELLFSNQQALGNGHLVEYADLLGLDISRFLQDISRQVHIHRISQDIASGYQSGVTVAPALFINGVRYTDRWNLEQLTVAISDAADCAH